MRATVITGNHVSENVASSNDAGPGWWKPRELPDPELLKIEVINPATGHATADYYYVFSRSQGLVYMRLESW